MKLRAALAGIGGLALFAAISTGSPAPSADEEALRALQKRYDAAVKAKDVSAIMSFYVPDESLFVFDATIPRQFVGAKAYRKNYESFFAAFPGPLESQNTDIAVAASGTLGYSRCIDTWHATDKAGRKSTFVFRVTDVYRKIGGRWLIIHEHVSFPADMETGKADMLSKP